MSKFGEDYEFPDEQEEKQSRKAAAEAKVEIEIEDDTPPEDRGRKPLREPVEDPTDDELASYDEKVQARIKKFTRGYHDERRAKEEAMREREAAEAYARQILEDNKRLQQQLASGSKELIETSKTAAESRLQAAKRKLKEAHEAADYDAVADAQAEIADATLEFKRAESMRPHEVDNDKFRPVEQQQVQKPVLSRRTQKWVDENSDWWGVDDEMTAAAVGLDKKLAKQYGAEYVGSEEYFRTIDKTMRKRFPEFFTDTQSEEDDPPPKKRAEPVDEDESPRRATKPATVVAPASRSTPPNRVKLKASEAAIARRLGVSLEEYAKQVAKLDRN